MDTTQNFNSYQTQNFNPLFYMNLNSEVNQNNNNFNQINPMNQMINNINFNMNNFNQMNQMNNNLDFNMNNINQMNQMNNNINFNMNNNNDDNNIIDLFPYIKEQKKIIKFINSNYESNSIKIPISMIKEDESSIEEIPEGAEINIIEDRPIPNTCYYDSLIKKYGNYDMRNIIFIEPSGKKKLFNFPGKATLSDAKISYNNKNGYNENMSQLIFDGEVLKGNDRRIIKDLTNTSLNIIAKITMETCNRKYFGKYLRGNVTVKNKANEKNDIINLKIEIGDLESTSKLFIIIENIMDKRRGIKKLYLLDKEINREDEKSLKSLGVKDNFNVVAEL